MIPFPSEEGGRCRACSCWLGVATGQGPPLQRAVRDVPPAQPFVPTRAHPEQGVQHCSDLNQLWSSSGLVQCKGGGHNTLGPSLASARWGSSSSEAEDGSRAALTCTACAGLSVPAGWSQTRELG